MKILAVDTSSANACIAILEDDKVLIELNNEDERTHSQKLMPMIDEAFKTVELSLDDIDLIVCGLGPGSFTGVRIGISTVKAFVDSKNINATGVSSLESLAYNLNQDGYICSLIDGGHGNSYAGLFHIVKDGLGFKTTEYDLKFLNLNSNELIDFIQNNKKFSVSDYPIYFVGNATIIYKNLLENLHFEKNNKIIFSNEKQNIISSISIAKAGYTKYKNGNYGNSNILSPIYLRKSQAELALEEKNLH